MKNIRLLKPQPSPRAGRNPLSNITNLYNSRERIQRETGRGSSLSPRHGVRPFRFDSKSPQRNKGYNKGICENRPSNSFVSNDVAVNYRTANHKREEGQNSKMVVQARQYIEVCNQILRDLNHKLGTLHFERTKTQKSFLKATKQIQEERSQVILRINEEYDQKIMRQEQLRWQLLQNITANEMQIQGLQRQFQTSRLDVGQNIQEMHGEFIKPAEFRQIMDIYWERVQSIGTTNNGNIVKPYLSDSSQQFQSKYLPPSEARSSRSKTQHSEVKNSFEKGFTFSKNLEGARGTFSWEDQEGVQQSAESVVQKKILIR